MVFNKGLNWVTIDHQSASIASLFGEAILVLDGLVKDAIETLDESGWVFERNAFEKKGLVEE